MKQAAAEGPTRGPALLQHIRARHGEGPLDDDFTIFKLLFPAS